MNFLFVNIVLEIVLVQVILAKTTLLPDNSKPLEMNSNLTINGNNMNGYHGEITDHRVVKKDLPMTISTLRWGDKNNTTYNDKEHDVQMLRMIYDKLNNQPRVNPQRRMAQYSRRYLPRYQLKY